MLQKCARETFKKSQLTQFHSFGQTMRFFLLPSDLQSETVHHFSTKNQIQQIEKSISKFKLNEFFLCLTRNFNAQAYKDI